MTRRRRLPLVLIGIGSLLAIVAILALWANRQLLDTDNWVETSSELLEDDDIRGQLSVFLVDELYTNVDVQAQLEEALPPRTKPLAGPVAGGLKNLAVRGADTLLTRPRLQAAWENANRGAHAALLNVVEGGGENVSTEGGDVVLDLKTLLGSTADSLGVGEKAAEKLPDDAAQLTLLESDELELAQDGVDLLKAAAIVLVVLSLGLMALAVLLARGWRREALRAAGFGLVFAGAAALVARSLAGGALVDSLASTEAVEPAIDSTWSISTSLMVEAASAAIMYGIVLVFSAWLAGPTRLATGTRRDPRALPARAGYRVLRPRRDRADPAGMGAHAGVPPADPDADPDRAARVRGRGAPPEDGEGVPACEPRGVDGAPARALLEHRRVRKAQAAGPARGPRTPGASARERRAQPGGVRTREGPAGLTATGSSGAAITTVPASMSWTPRLRSSNRIGTNPRSSGMAARVM